VKDDELRYMKALANLRTSSMSLDPLADYVAEQLGINHKRADYILRKWENKGWWDYGVSLRAGWLTADGMQQLKEADATETKA